MPTDLGPSRWLLPDPRQVPPGDEVVAVGGDIDPPTLLAGYRIGLFPMPGSGGLYWLSPDPRGILPTGGFRWTRSMWRSARRFTVSVDGAFREVLDACADERRPGAWIDARYRRAYSSLHASGWAHTVEVWSDGRLVGGLLGVEVGGLFCGETMFHRQTDASKIAFWATASLLAADGREDRLFDVQWATSHLASLGVVEVPRDEYLARLHRALGLAPVLGPMPSVPARDLLAITGARPASG